MLSGVQESSRSETTPRSHGLVWVEHNSHSGAHGTRGKVLCELDSDDSSMSVGIDDLAPRDSVSGVIYVVFDLVYICNSFS